MGKYCGLGTYNKNTKYLLFYMISRFLYESMAGLKYGTLYYPIRLYDKQKVIKSHKLVIDTFGYFGILLLSFIIIKLEPENKKISINIQNISKKSISHKKSFRIRLIYDEKGTFKNNKIRTIFVAFTWVLHIQLVKLYYQSNFGYLDYWALEMVITYYISKKVFKIEIYSHQKFSIFFITIFCSFLILCSFIITLVDEKDIIYKKYPIFIPIGIIIYLIILSIRSYSNCKIKWLTDLKFISTGKFLAIYGLVGAISCSIVTTITTLVDCGKNKLELCYQEKGGKTYYDSFTIFFDEYFRDSFKFYDIFLFAFQIIFNFFTSLFYVLTIKYLTPVYAVCLPSIHYFLLQILLLFNTIIQGKSEIITSQIVKVIIEISTDLFSVLGIFVYIEFIELKFCGLNYNSRKTIEKRSLEEMNLTRMVSEDEDDLEEKI